MTILRPIMLALAVLTASPAATPSLAQDALDAIADISLLPGWRSESGAHITALRVALAPGWKTYWRAPGEAGIPPRFDWSGSSNMKAVAFHWPVPKVHEQNGMTTFGYETLFILPIELTPERNGEPIAVRASVELGVCLDICVPVSVRVDADLGLGGQPDARIRSAINDRPFTAAEASVAEARCAIEPIKDGMRVKATVTMPSLGPGEVAVFEHRDQRIWIAEAVVARDGRSLTAVTEMVPPSNKPFSLNRSDLLITVFGNGQAVEIEGCTG
ncbi:MAG: protein-disulfide reductase DsbD domain-containing protein [Pseudomonadota bacterium]